MSEAARRGGAFGVDALLYPSNIAIVGATERPGNWALRVWNALRKHAYRGRIFPVNPRYQTIWNGETCYRSLDALPEPPDHIVVLVPGSAAIDALIAAGKAGGRSATIFSSGFGEGGDPDGRALQIKLAEAIRASGLAVSGPNCNGNVSAPHCMLTIPDDRITLEPGPIAIFGQSGGIVMALHRTLGSRGVGVSYSVTSGNELGLNAADYIRFFTADPNIRVIAAFIEAIRDPAAFLTACTEAKAAGKPVVAIKLGGSEASRQAALAHTGSLAGSLACFDAVAGAAGVIRMDTIDEIVETVEFVAHAKIPVGPRIGAITFSGGLKALLAEAAARTGAVFPRLSEPSLAALRQILGIGTSLGNPLDAGFTALSSREAYFRCIDIMLAEPNIDLLIVQEELPRQLGANRKIENMREINRKVAEGVPKPIAVFSMGSYMFTDESRDFRRELPHLPFLQDVQKTVRAIRALGDYGATRASRLPQRAAGAVAPWIRAILINAHRRNDGRAVLDEHDSKALLRAYGFALMAEEAVTSAQDAIAAAERIGYPVVLKLLSREIAHKTDIGGVALGLTSSGAVRRAFAHMAASLAKHDPQRALDRVLVAKQAGGGLEVALGVQRDPEMGPVVMFGAGGSLLELYRDVSFGPAPLSAEAADRMIDRTRIGRVIDGYRGSVRRDRKAVVIALVALGRLADDLRDSLESVDINPLAVMADGEGAVALDALVVLRAIPEVP
jgi:acetyltransferase